MTFWRICIGGWGMSCFGFYSLNILITVDKNVYCTYVHWMSWQAKFYHKVDNVNYGVQCPRRVLSDVLNTIWIIATHLNLLMLNHNVINLLDYSQFWQNIDNQDDSGLIYVEIYIIYNIHLRDRQTFKDRTKWHTNTPCRSQTDCTSYVSFLLTH